MMGWDGMGMTLPPPINQLDELEVMLGRNRLFEVEQWDSYKMVLRMVLQMKMEIKLAVEALPKSSSTRLLLLIP